jgi:hypothetical protein
MSGFGEPSRVGIKIPRAVRGGDRCGPRRLIRDLHASSEFRWGAKTGALSWLLVERGESSAISLESVRGTKSLVLGSPGKSVPIIAEPARLPEPAREPERPSLPRPEPCPAERSGQAKEPTAA